MTILEKIEQLKKLLDIAKENNEMYGDDEYKKDIEALEWAINELSKL